MKLWTCKIGTTGTLDLPPAADGPMREAIAQAYFDLTGEHADFIFSGWGDPLPEHELAVVEDRLPATFYPCPRCAAPAERVCVGSTGEGVPEVCGARLDLVTA